MKQIEVIEIIQATTGRRYSKPSVTKWKKQGLLFTDECTHAEVVAFAHWLNTRVVVRKARVITVGIPILVARRAIDDTGLSLRELAKKVNASYSMLSYIQSGKRKMTAYLFDEIKSIGR